MPKIIAKNVLVAGHLSKHDHFQTRKNGKWYTVHAQVLEYFNDDNCNKGRGEFYVIAVCKRKMYVFDYDQKVLLPCH